MSPAWSGEMPKSPPTSHTNQLTVTQPRLQQCSGSGELPCPGDPGDNDRCTSIVYPRSQLISLQDRIDQSATPVGSAVLHLRVMFG